MRSIFGGIVSFARIASWACIAFIGVAGAAHAQSADFAVRILSVECIETTTGPARDDVYLEFSTGERIPRRSADSITMDSGDVWNPKATVRATDSLQVTVWELDDVGSDDEIGSFVVYADDDDGRYTEQLSGDGSNYEVTYEVAHRQ